MKIEDHEYREKDYRRFTLLEVTTIMCLGMAAVYGMLIGLIVWLA